MVRAPRWRCSSTRVLASSGRTVMKKYPANTTGRRDFDTAIHDNTVDKMATQKTRTAKSAVRATDSLPNVPPHLGGYSACL